MSTKLRILCLHGKWQNGEVFYTKLGALRKMLKNCEFVAITAPFETPEKFERHVGYMWWDAEGRIETDTDVPRWTQYIGLEESIELVRKVVKEQGPFDGLLAFSQGGILGSMLACRSEGFRFAILCSTYSPTTEKGEALYKRCLQEEEQIPTLHTFGSADEIIRAPRSLTLATEMGAKQIFNLDELETEMIHNKKLSIAFDHQGAHTPPIINESRKVVHKYIQLLIPYLQAQNLATDTVPKL